MAEKEKAFYKGEGELIIKKREHRGAGRKVASWLAGGPIGYVLIGRDKKMKSKAKGALVVTDKAIYCAGNAYSYDKILSLTKKGTISKSIVLTFEKAAEGERFDIEAELKSKDIGGLFQALENARMSEVDFSEVK